MADTVQVKAILDAVQAALSGTTVAFDERVYLSLADRDEETFPYAVVEVIGGREMTTTDSDGQALRMRVGGYADTTQGPISLVEGIDQIRNVLQDLRLTAVGHDVTPIRADGFDGPIMDEGLWRVDADYLVDVFREGS